jgi:hypothetical protein
MKIKVTIDPWSWTASTRCRRLSFSLSLAPCVAGLLFHRGAVGVADHFHADDGVHILQGPQPLPRGGEGLLDAQGRVEGATAAMGASVFVVPVVALHVCFRFTLTHFPLRRNLIQGNLAKLPKTFGGEAGDSQSTWLADEVKKMAATTDSAAPSAHTT